MELQLAEILADWSLVSLAGVSVAKTGIVKTKVEIMAVVKIKLLCFIKAQVFLPVVNEGRDARDFDLIFGEVFDFI